MEELDNKCLYPIGPLMACLNTNGKLKCKSRGKLNVKDIPHVFYNRLAIECFRRRSIQNCVLIRELNRLGVWFNYHSRSFMWFFGRQNKQADDRTARIVVVPCYSDSECIVACPKLRHSAKIRKQSWFVTVSKQIRPTWLALCWVLQYSQYLGGSKAKSVPSCIYNLETR